MRNSKFAVRIRINFTDKRTIFRKVSNQNKTGSIPLMWESRPKRKLSQRTKMSTLGKIILIRIFSQMSKYLRETVKKAKYLIKNCGRRKVR